MGAIASQITSLTVVYSPFIQTQIKENHKAPRHWPLCGEFTGTDDFPAQMASNAESVSIWWRHHEYLPPIFFYPEEAMSQPSKRKHIEAETKWPTFSSRHLQMLFLEWKAFSYD